jgi:exocyst complex component 6
MCLSAISITSKALNDVSDAETMLKIKGVIALFIQTMEVRRPCSTYNVPPLV